MIFKRFFTAEGLNFFTFRSPCPVKYEVYLTGACPVKFTIVTAKRISLGSAKSKKTKPLPTIALAQARRAGQRSLRLSGECL